MKVQGKPLEGNKPYHQESQSVTNKRHNLQVNFAFGDSVK